MTSSDRDGGVTTGAFGALEQSMHRVREKHEWRGLGMLRVGNIYHIWQGTGRWPGDSVSPVGMSPGPSSPASSQTSSSSQPHWAPTQEVNTNYKFKKEAVETTIPQKNYPRQSSNKGRPPFHLQIPHIPPYQHRHHKHHQVGRSNWFHTGKGLSQYWQGGSWLAPPLANEAFWRHRCRGSCSVAEPKLGCEPQHLSFERLDCREWSWEVKDMSQSRGIPKL